DSIQLPSRTALVVGSCRFSELGPIVRTYVCVMATAVGKLGLSRIGTDRRFGFWVLRFEFRVSSSAFVGYCLPCAKTRNAKPETRNPQPKTLPGFSVAVLTDSVNSCAPSAAWL